MVEQVSGGSRITRWIGTDNVGRGDLVKGVDGVIQGQASLRKGVVAQDAVGSFREVETHFVSSHCWIVRWILRE